MAVELPANIEVEFKLNGSVKEPNISFFHSSISGVLFAMFCLLVEVECQILVF